MISKKERQKIEQICEQALRKATPSKEERLRTILFCEGKARELGSELEKAGVKAEVEIQGSIAKDTWLAGEKDIDMFILLPKTYKRDDFSKVLNIVKKAAGENWLEAYAEHPYIEARIDEFTIDFVPAFKIEMAQEAKSSVDRTPLHTEYVKRHLNEEGKKEVRLLKRFMHGTGTYGAEIKVGGFSGYLCEILTLYYGSFCNTIAAGSKWREKEVIDIEGYYEREEDEARKIFQDNLIVIDPVDRGRNVASAVSESRLNEFIAAAQWFTKSPSFKFFYPDETPLFSKKELDAIIRQRRSTLTFVRFQTAKAVPDILWGQLYKSLKSLRTAIEQHDFEVTRCAVWTDEETETILLFELGSRFLPSFKKHLGPPVKKSEDSERFLLKHLRSEKTISGPYVDGARWMVETERTYIDVVSLLGDKLKDGGKGLGIATLVSGAFSKHFEIIVNEEIVHFYQSNPKFAKFLVEYLISKPPWLQ